MKVIRYIIIQVLFILPLCSIAQPVIKLVQQRHDFGTIEEEAGKVTHRFNFVNAGNDTLLINKVRTSCGCTKPVYPDTPIAPGDSSYIEITFDPTNRVGNFSKPIYVFANTTPDRTILRIIGKVVRSAIADTARSYAYRIGDIALKSLHIPYEKLIKGKPATREIELFNAGKETLTPYATNVPPHITVKFIPDTLLTGEKGKMQVTYIPDAIDDWGYRRDEFDLAGTVSPNDSLDVLFSTISLSGVLQEDFDSYSEEEMENAPILVVGRDKVDFKVVTGTQKVRREIYVVNAGFSPLVIHKIRQDGRVIKAHLKKNKLPPGQSTKLTIEVDPLLARSNAITSQLHLVSNDPTNQQQAIKVVVEFQ